MIISASRRTDIPAFYTEWFFRRLREGYVLVRNPMNYHQVSKVALHPEVVDGIVFWTKNPEPMLNRLDRLEGYEYYFQFTLNPYSQDLEPFLPEKEERIDTFLRLGERIGRERMIWRYDPIVFSDDYSVAYHTEKFAYLAERLSPYTEKCIISFLDGYRKINSRLQAFNIVMDNTQAKEQLLVQLAALGRKYRLDIEACAEAEDMSSWGIGRASCVDEERISRLSGCRMEVKKDKSQRGLCGCASAIDIGAYDTCRHGCLYCYAIRKIQIPSEALPEINAPILGGDIKVEDRISIRKMKSHKINA